MKRKFDNFEHKVLGNFALMKKQEGNSLGKDEILLLVERGKIVMEEK